jgi:hypothetical protein
LESLGRRTMLVTARRLVHPDNNSTNILVVFDDVTDARQASFEKDVLLEETRHRMKNMQTVVHAIAFQTKVEGRTAGALSSPSGVVHLGWRALGDNEEASLEPDWREEKGPPCNAAQSSGIRDRND